MTSIQLGETKALLKEAREEITEVKKNLSLLEDLLKDFSQENNELEERINTLEDGILKIRDNIRNTCRLLDQDGAKPSMATLDVLAAVVDEIIEQNSTTQTRT
jgi:chromosome segregation ATPase